MQTTSHILMIQPVNFGYNTETAVNNTFQIAGNETDAQNKAATEFRQFVDLLSQYGVDVTVIKDTPHPHTPDSIFPNNWISFHQDGTVILYPMYAHNRRLERKPHVLDTIRNKFKITSQVDLSAYEVQNIFLEGTGSMVLDRDYKIAYACLSPRTDKKALATFCQITGYEPLSFTAVDETGKKIYHTNVMMCVADKYVVICLDAICNMVEKEMVVKKIIESDKGMIEISHSQMNRFAGNMLQIRNNKNEKLLVMSSQAFTSLTSLQIKKLESYNKIIHSNLATIETNGGGSARCMMAEIHLPLA